MHHALRRAHGARGALRGALRAQRPPSAWQALGRCLSSVHGVGDSTFPTTDDVILYISEGRYSWEEVPEVAEGEPTEGLRHARRVIADASAASTPGQQRKPFLDVTSGFGGPSLAASLARADGAAGA